MKKFKKQCWISTCILLLCVAMLLTACDSGENAKQNNSPNSPKQTFEENITVPIDSEQKTTGTVGTNEIPTQPTDPINPTDPCINGHKCENNVCTVCGLEFSSGLEFTSNQDGTCYISGIGTCTSSKILIPPTSPNGDTVTGLAFTTVDEIVEWTKKHTL